MSTTGTQASASTGSGVTATMLQIATPSTRQMQLISWGYSYNTIQAAVATVELVQTDVAATVTAHVASGVQPLDPNAPPSLVSLGIAATGYTATVEGTSTATRTFDAIKINGSSGSNGAFVLYSYQWMPDERPIVAVSKFLRVRVNMGTSTGLVCWVCWDE
jgi:hypothetical protein